MATISDSSIAAPTCNASCVDCIARSRRLSESDWSSAFEIEPGSPVTGSEMASVSSSSATVSVCLLRFRDVLEGGVVERHPQLSVAVVGKPFLVTLFQPQDFFVTKFVRHIFGQFRFLRPHLDRPVRSSSTVLPYLWCRLPTSADLQSSLQRGCHDRLVSGIGRPGDNDCDPSAESCELSVGCRLVGRRSSCSSQPLLASRFCISFPKKIIGVRSHPDPNSMRATF